jgi:hypothetical protein
MLCGWVSQKESFPLGEIAAAFKSGVKELDKNQSRDIVDGVAGTVFGMAINLTNSQEVKEVLRHGNIQLLKEQIGGSFKISHIQTIEENNWLEVRGRLTGSNVVSQCIEDLGLSDLLSSATVAVITQRTYPTDRSKVDEGAPVGIHRLLIGGTVGAVSVMISDLPQLGLKRTNEDGKQVIAKVATEIPVVSIQDPELTHNTRAYLEKTFLHEPYSLHWVFVDPLRRFVHLMRSEEMDAKARENLYLFAGKNQKTGTIVFASKKEMIGDAFGKLDVNAIHERAIQTHYTYN